MIEMRPIGHVRSPFTDIAEIQGARRVLLISGVNEQGFSLSSGRLPAR